MRKLVVLLLIVTVACGPAPWASTPTPSAALPSATLPPQATATAAPTLTPAPSDTHVSEATATATLTVVAEPTAAPAAEEAGPLTAASVIFHPDPVLYSGDRVSVEVLGQNLPEAWAGATVWLFHDTREGEPIAREHFGRFGLGGRAQATFTWVWDTTGLVGEQTLLIVVEPLAREGALPLPEFVLPVTVTLLPAESRPDPEAGAQWATAQSVCCIFHYLTGTAAERDLPVIMDEADRAFAQVEATLGVARQQPVTFTLVSRLLGHGGFASTEVSLSYLDRNPAHTDLFSVFAHEGTHILDRQIARTRPIFMTEGLAVYVAGGHFKAEALDQRAAALLHMGGYIPLESLANNFYPAQHEIGYLEAGAFIHYLVERFGWPRFRDFYASFGPAESDAAMLDKALRPHFGQGLAELEADWLAHLGTLPYDARQVEDLRLTIELFDTLRRYQREMDPAAYFLNAWLPNGPEARRQQIVADFVRHPATPENIALEAMLVAAGQALVGGDFADAADLLSGANAALDGGHPTADPLAAHYWNITNQLLLAGYEPQTITLDEATASVTAIRDWPQLDHLDLMHGEGDGWYVTAAGRHARVLLGEGIILRRLLSARQPARGPAN